MSNFSDFFERATDGLEPYPYQRRLAERSWDQWPTILDIPTGLGKTAAVVIGWLWRRHEQPGETPRRLVYTLPMRSLVHQTVDAAREWVANLEGDPDDVHVLMGGETDTGWVDDPGDDAILVGTQDMLVSRALMRGYGMSRYEWPVHYALLHNDAFWVFDETQLMGVSLETSLQLEEFREKFGTAAPCKSLWMSATVDEEAFETVDRSPPEGGWPDLQLDDEDRDQKAVEARIEAEKTVEFADTTIPNSSAANKLGDYADDLADEILEAHDDHDQLTLVVVNRVNRARMLAERLDHAGIDPLLLHSRFRQHERQHLEEDLTEASENQEHRIVVATQVVEAGLDVDSRLLVTELAPWASIVQRAGRCNRNGEYESARVLVVEADDGDKAARPYEPEQLQKARERLTAGDSLSPVDLEDIDPPSPDRLNHVLRRRDFVELFDTSPDLGGNDLDVKRYVRDVEDTDVLVYWKSWESEGPPDNTSAPDRVEVCRVPCWGDEGIRKFLDNNPGWRWNPLGEEWEAVDDPRPGQTILLHAETGGYDSDRGWTADADDTDIEVLETNRDRPAGINDDDTRAYQWIELTDHLERVAKHAEKLAEDLDDNLDMPADEIDVRSLLVEAAAWHDVGKAHHVFQNMLTEPVPKHDGIAPPDRTNQPYAKSNHRKGSPERPYFRHELASALAILAERSDGDELPPLDRREDLLTYLVAAHHGRVRLSLRSLPNEKTPDDAHRRFARGVWDEDPLPGVDVPGVEAPKTTNGTTIDLEVMELGRGSWLERALALRDDEDLGPFRVAYLEALLRIADRRASAEEREQND